MVDLAAHLGITADAITVSSVEQVERNMPTWGCTSPGQTYAQVITPGLRIVPEVDGRSYECHTVGGGIVRCQP